jgi:predicted nicotinamide N-methyase
MAVWSDWELWPCCEGAEKRTVRLLRPADPHATDLQEAGDDAASDASSDTSYSDAAPLELALWAYVWSSNTFLAELLLAGRDASSWRGERVLEVGAGVGALGVLCATLGADVWVTDKAPEGLTLAERAAAEGNGTRVRTAVLDWNEAESWSRVRWGAEGEEEKATLVLGSDVLYLPRSSAPLLRMVDGLLAPGGVALIADPCRPAGDDVESVAAAGIVDLELRTVHRASYVASGDAKHAVRHLRVFEFHKPPSPSPPATPSFLDAPLRWMQAHRRAPDDPSADLFEPDLYRAAPPAVDGPPDDEEEEMEEL